MNRLLKELKKRSGEHILFISVTMLTAGIQFLYSIYVKMYIVPSEYGIYSTCLLLQTYLTYLQLGTLNAFNRDYSQIIGAKKHEQAKKYRDTVFSFLLVIFGLALVCVIVSIIVIAKYVSMDIRFCYGYILISVITVITIIENFGNYRCRIDKGFTYPSLVTLFELLAIPVGFFLIPYMGYYAIYIVSIITMLIGIFLYYKCSYKDIEIKIDFKLLREILISGMPLLINSLIWTVVNSIDKFVILGFLDTEALGIYGIAQNAFSYMILVPSALSQLFYAQMGKKYGETGQKSDLNSVAIRYTAILGGVTSTMALIAYFFFPLLVERIMPNYTSGISSAQILILGLTIYATTMINGNILTILKKNVAIIRNSVYMCVFNAICSILFLYIVGHRIESVALGTAVSYIFCAMILIYQVYKYAECDLKELVMASVVPVIISLFPGIIFYNCIKNRILGFLFSILVVIIIYYIKFRKLKKD